MANQAITKLIIDSLPDFVVVSILVITVVAIIVTIIWQIIAKCRENVSKKVTTPENKGLLQSRQAGY